MANEKKAAAADAAENDAAPNVVVEVVKAIAFGGVKCSPKTDQKGKVVEKTGEAAKAVVPRDIAKIHEAAGRVRIIGPAHEGQRPGNIDG